MWRWCERAKAGKSCYPGGGRQGSGHTTPPPKLRKQTRNLGQVQKDWEPRTSFCDLPGCTVTPRRGLGVGARLSELRLQGSDRRACWTGFRRSFWGSQTHPSPSPWLQLLCKCFLPYQIFVKTLKGGSFKWSFMSRDHINRGPWAQRGLAQEQEEVDTPGPRGAQAPQRGSPAVGSSSAEGPGISFAQGP